jgi:hypothetical protein
VLRRYAQLVTSHYRLVYHDKKNAQVKFSTEKFFKKSDETLTKFEEETSTSKTAPNPLQDFLLSPLQNHHQQALHPNIKVFLLSKNFRQ